MHKKSLPILVRHPYLWVFSIAILLAHNMAAYALSVSLAWDRNTEPDIAGYKLYYGTSSGRYSYTNNVGNTTNATVSTLFAGTTYYFVVTAYNTSGLESAPSNEVMYKTPSAPVVTWNTPTAITYGTALNSLQLNATANVAGTFIYSPKAGTVLAAGSTQVLTTTFTPLDTNNYMTVTKTVSITVQRALLKITADYKTKVYGATMPTLTASYAGFVNGDTASKLSTPVSLSASATANSGVGTYPIVAGGATSPNYSITFVNGTLTITSATGTTSATRSFANATAITIPDQGAAKTYPSTISVSGLAGTVSKITVKVSSISHTWPEDVGILLVGPTGQNVVLMSHIGGQGNNSLNGVTLTFDDAATAVLPDPGTVTSGSYKPTTYSTPKVYPDPAPVTPFGSTLSVFTGTNPNGPWSLYVFDSSSGDSGNIAGGWSLTVTTISSTSLAGLSSESFNSMRLTKLAPMEDTAADTMITAIALYDNRQIGITFRSVANHHYRIEVSTNQDDWQYVGQLTAASELSHFIDTNPSAGDQRFYRVIYLPLGKPVGAITVPVNDEPIAVGQLLTQ